MSQTKKAKMVSVSWVETKSYYAKYICPSCHTEYHGGGVNKSTLRFRCECGQELIVKNTLPAVGGLTQPAPDAGESAASSGIVNASADSTSQAESAPTQRG